MTDPRSLPTLFAVLAARQFASQANKMPTLPTPNHATSRNRQATHQNSPRSLFHTSTNSLVSSLSSPFRRSGATSRGSPLPQSRTRAPYAASTLSKEIQMSSAAPSMKDFQPSLPEATPKLPRMLTEGDVMYSANGSPIFHPWTTPHAGSNKTQQVSPLDKRKSNHIPRQDDDENELPDPEALEREMLASKSLHTSRGATLDPSAPKSRGLSQKRTSTIRIRQSLSIGQAGYLDPFLDAGSHRTLPSTANPAPTTTAAAATSLDSPARLSNRGAMLRVTTSSGLTLDFDPLSDDPEMIEEELKGQGVNQEVREQVRKEMAIKVQELRDRLAK